MVLEQGVTERAEAIRMKRQLTYAGVKIIGAVLNRLVLIQTVMVMVTATDMAMVTDMAMAKSKMIRKRRAKNNGQ